MLGRRADHLAADGQFEHDALADEDFFDRLQFDRTVRIELLAGIKSIADLEVFDDLVAMLPVQRRADAGMVICALRYYCATSINLCSHSLLISD